MTRRLPGASNGGTFSPKFEPTSLSWWLFSDLSNELPFDLFSLEDDVISIKLSVDIEYSLTIEFVLEYENSLSEVIRLDEMEKTRVLIMTVELYLDLIYDGENNLFNIRSHDILYSDSIKQDFGEIE